MDFFLDFINKPIKLFILCTFIYGTYNLLWKRKKAHLYLVIILTICITTEICNSFLIFYKRDINFCSSLSVLLHNTLWLLLIRKHIFFKKVFNVLFTGYLFYSLINLFYINSINNFNYSTFIAGAFLYIAIFIYESFYQLKKENFNYFLSNTFLLLFSPVLFFLGLSFYFGFQNSDLGDIHIFGSIKLYSFIIYFVNLVYYSLINIYIYREKKLQNAG